MTGPVTVAALAAIAATVLSIPPAAAAPADDRPASIAGIVTDAEGGQPLAGAIVSLPDLDRHAATGADGRYVLSNVPPGPQHVTVRRIGCSSQAFHALVPRRGTLEINVSLRSQPIQLETVDVRAGLPLRGLEPADSAGYPNRAFSIAAVRNHPLLPEPDVLEAAQGGEVILHPETPSGIRVRGSAPDQIAYVLDGIPVLSPYHAAGVFSSFNPDALSHVELLTSAARPDLPDALAGVLWATSRDPGTQLRVQGGISTTQVRATIDGPLGRRGAGYLLSLRLPFTGLLVNKRESSHLVGEGIDGVAKLAAPLFGGRLAALWYQGESEVTAHATVASEVPGSPGADRTRNQFAWDSRSAGASWTRRIGGVRLDLRAWRAAGNAEATWRPDSLTTRLTWERRDVGGSAIAAFSVWGGSTDVGVRVRGSRTSYLARPDSGQAFAQTARVTVPTPFARHRRGLGRGEIDVSLASPLLAGRSYLCPTAQARWTLGGGLSVTGTYARRAQLEQSLRNTESVVSNVFPADLFVAARGTQVPVARADLGVLALEHRPAAGIHLGLTAYTRRSTGLALVAPRSAGPFAAADLVTGSGDARGLTVEVTAGGSRYGILASYGLADVSVAYADSAYVPDDAPTHSAEAGVIFFPSATSSVRLGVTTAFGRRTSAVYGPFEWEACNLLDMGCELAGSPDERADPLGTTRLPAYVRVDLGVRKHWHVRIAGREGQLAAFGTATNLLGRRNVLTFAVDPTTGARTAVEMRPLSPLVVGVDWLF